MRRISKRRRCGHANWWWLGSANREGAEAAAVEEGEEAIVKAKSLATIRLPMLRSAAAGLVLAALLTAQKKPVTVDAVVNSPPSSLAAITWAPDGERFISTERGELSLHEIRSGKERSVIAIDKLEKAAVPVPSEQVFDWTNRRVGEHDVQWFADGKRLLVAAAGDLFIVDIDKGRFEALTQTAEIERDPKLSPDNRYVSFRRGPDLYTIEIASKVVTRLTTNGSDTLLNGQLDWVYPEELDLDTAHWWSPDSRSIAYLQFDIAREPVSPQVSLLNARGLLEPERYPKAGDPNAEVRLGIVPAARRRNEVDGSRRTARLPAGARRVVARQPRDSGRAVESRAEQAGSAAGRYRHGRLACSPA